MNASYSERERLLLLLAARGELDESTRTALSRTCAEGVSDADLEKICAAVIETDTNGVYKGNRAGFLHLADEVVARLERRNCFAVTLLSADYPAALAAIPDPPLVLFCAGRRELLGARKFCIVGSRLLPAWAAKAGKNIAQELSARFVIVTGIAEGGDRAAIDGALPAGNLISVLPCGLDVDYPAAHAALKREIAGRGLVVTEYPFGTRAQKYSFHARNRILAGLSEGVLVLAAGEKSGTLITANAALSYGRDVFALPHNAGAAQGAGCNELIKQGAYLCTDAGDVLEAYGMPRTARREPALTPAEEKLLGALRQRGEAHAAVLAQLAGVPVWEAQATLAALELKGLIARSGGNQYAALK